MAAGEDPSQEKTEEPTAKKKQKALDEGQVARSRDLNSTIVLLAGAVSLLVFGGFIFNGLLGILHAGFSLERELIYDIDLFFSFLMYLATQGLIILGPFFAVMLVAALIGPISMGGAQFRAKAFAPKLNKLDPIAGIKRIFSANSLMELFKAVAKVLVIGVGAVMIFAGLSNQILGLGGLPLERGVFYAFFIMGWAFLFLSALLILIALIDVPWQQYTHLKKLRMTKQEVKDEHKETEGQPEVKRKIRQKQMEAAMRRMMASVPQADVVITNPTHFAVALKYDQAKMHAPKVIAKGVDDVAAEIRERARIANVPLFSAPLLARALFYSTRIDEYVPAGLYMAVAQVLAYIFQLRTSWADSSAPVPEAPTDVIVPEEFLARERNNVG